MEELKPTKRMPKRQIKRRRGKYFVFEDGEWHQISKDKVMLPPSGDPKELMDQIYDSRKAGQFLKFVGSAMETPVFNADHAATTVTVLAAEKKHLDAAKIAELQSHPTIAALAAKGQELFESDQDMDLWGVASALRGLALYRQDLPALRDALVPSLTKRAVDSADDMLSRQVADVVWACAQMYEDHLPLATDLLPKFAGLNRVRAVQAYLKKKAPEQYGLMEKSFLKLKKERPDIRAWLPDF